MFKVHVVWLFFNKFRFNIFNQEISSHLLSLLRVISVLKSFLKEYENCKREAYQPQSLGPYYECYNLFPIISTNPPRPQSHPLNAINRTLSLEVGREGWVRPPRLTWGQSWRSSRRRSGGRWYWGGRCPCRCTGRTSRWPPRQAKQQKW